MGHKSSKFGFGLILGTLIGAGAAMLLSPKTGEENRKWAKDKLDELKKTMDDAEVEKKVREIYGTASEEGIKLYKEAKKEITKRIQDLKETFDESDPEQYKKVAADALDSLKDYANASAHTLERLKEYFLAGKSSDKA